MDVEVRLFASWRDAVGADEVSVAGVPEPVTIGGIRTRLLEDWPALVGLPAVAAVDHRHASDVVEVRRDQVVAFLPPVSGG